MHNDLGGCMMKQTGLFLTSFFCAVAAWGWGAVGHRATGFIAEANLTPQARAAIQRYVGDANLAEIANWADYLRGNDQYKHASPYHYESVPDGKTFLQDLSSKNRQQIQTGSLVPAIFRAKTVLRDSRASDEEKAISLKFLVHFIGDLHQPLHSGRPEDRGGNSVKVVWFGRPSNLHSVWDTGLIMTGHADLFAGQPSNADYGLIYARWLLQRYRNIRPRVETMGQVERWLNESIYARTRAYDRRVHTDPERYQDEVLPAVDSRVYEAGHRLAEVLNRIFANHPLPPSDMTFYRQIERITGPLMKIIFLHPR